MDQERISFLALHFVPWIGHRLLRQLVAHCGSAQEVFRTPKGKLLKVPGVGERAADSIRNGSTFYHAERELKKAEREFVQIVFYLDKMFPLRLRSIDDSPSLLYVKGNINLNHARVVGIVGTRRATSYGTDMVERLIADLVPHEALVVSGLAYGIDIHAHRSALRNNLPTVGVLGSGIDVIYPSIHQETARKMLDRGGLITENPFGVQPDGHHFPARNRIIAGLCDALIIVEAAEKGGALITAEIANTYNRDVFAVPGNVGAPFSAGCNKLIKINKANLLTGINDLEYIMNWNAKGMSDAKGGTLSLFDTSGLHSDEQKVIRLLQEKKRALPIDELSLLSEIPPGLLSSILLTLEFAGWIVSLPGKQYAIAKDRNH